MNKITKLRYMSNKYGNIDLSALEWSKEELNFVSTPLPNAKIPTSDIAANMICSKYRSVPLNVSFVEGDFAINPLGCLYVRDTKYGDVISFKESLKNLILTYELATDNSGGYLPINKIRYMSNQFGNSVLTDNIFVEYVNSKKFFYIIGWSGDNLYKRVASNVIPKMGLLDYKAESNGNLYDFISNDKTVSLGFPGMYDNFIMVRDLSFNGNTEKFKQFIIGNNVWFELETPAQGGYLPYTKLKYKASDFCQLFDKDKFFATRTAHGVVFTNNSDGSFTINGTCDSDADADIPLFLPDTGYSVTFDLYSIENHKYLLIPFPQAFSYSTLRFIFGTGAVPYYETSNTYEIYTATKTGTYPCYAIYRVGAGETINNLTVKPQLFDLTEMYGAGNEPTTLAEFRQKYPNDLYPYSPQCWY